MVFIAMPVRADSLYEALGGEQGIARFVDRTVDLAFKNPRIAHTFEKTNAERLKRLLTEQFCDLSGGPCEYSGVDMKKAHVGLGLTTLHFNALVEDLQTAMDETGIPFRTQNRLLALLAPMHRDVVEK